MLTLNDPPTHSSVGHLTAEKVDYDHCYRQATTALGRAVSALDEYNRFAKTAESIHEGNFQPMGLRVADRWN
jgi:hypothetical protein